MELDTFPKLLLDNARRLSSKAAIREKRLGIWQTWSWSQSCSQVLDFAAGLHTLGFKRGDKIAIVGRNRPQLYWGMAAAQCLGGVPVPVYSDSVAEEMEFILHHAEVRFVLVEDQEQVDKTLEIVDRLPALEGIIVDDDSGLEQYTDDRLHSYSEVQRRGRDELARNPERVEVEIQQGRGADIGIFLYTSGTTGRPKGVVLTNDNVLITCRNSVEYDRIGPDEEVLAYLPMAWVGDHIFSYGQSYVAGFCVNCPESEHTVHLDLREIGPTYYFAPPRIFENMLTGVVVRMEDASRLKRRMFGYFMAVAKQFGAAILNRQPVRLLDRLKYYLGSILVYAPLKNAMGFSRIRLAYTAGEAIGPETFDFYRSLGVNIKQLYGQTEAAVFVTMQPDGEVYADTVGVPAPEVEVKITDRGEVAYRGPGVFHSYYKEEQATRETKDADGWVFTGDAGFFNDRGHLKIIDRTKDVGKLNDGTMFAPKYLENKLKFFPEITEAVAFGDGHDYVVAFINIDLDAVGNWAERHTVAYASYQELAAHPQVYAMIRASVEAVNRDLAADPDLSGSQIKRFLILHKELDPDDGEMTRTRKVRRMTVADKYRDLIDALYSEQTGCHVKTEVTFEDGRMGMIEADLIIQDAATCPHNTARVG